METRVRWAASLALVIPHQHEKTSVDTCISKRVSAAFLFLFSGFICVFSHVYLCESQPCVCARVCLHVRKRTKLLEASRGC